jgi:hypothetical protein
LGPLPSISVTSVGWDQLTSTLGGATARGNGTEVPCAPAVMPRKNGKVACPMGRVSNREVQEGRSAANPRAGRELPRDSTT